MEGRGTEAESWTGERGEEKGNGVLVETNER